MIYEEGLPYTMQIGNVFADRYLILDKLGLGSKSKTPSMVYFRSRIKTNIIYSLFNSLDSS